ncbi:metal ABC transporter permease [Undibacterium arcticum]
MFALAVTASVQLVGVYLVFASLIVPSLGVRNYGGAKKTSAARLFDWHRRLWGRIAAIDDFFDLPSGALIVWCLALLAILVYASGPRKELAPN